MPFLPPKFLERLSLIIPESLYVSVMETFHQHSDVCFRVNTLKASQKDIVEVLAQEEFSLHRISHVSNAFTLPFEQRETFVQHAFVREGQVYMQSASSLLPALILNVQKEDTVLDACAAPGSKTSQMAMMMKNTGKIIAVESVKNRFYKLKSVCSLLGVSCVDARLADMKKFRFPDQTFDKVLVDAPCSSESRFKSFHPKTYQYWSERKIKEMSFKQKGILLNAARGLKSGGTLVYSTCSFSPEENEEVVDWFLKKTGSLFVLDKIDLPDFFCQYPTVQSWKGRSYSSDLNFCVRILPTKTTDGFFIAKFKKGQNNARF